MFKDYYRILDITFPSDINCIKKAYHKQSVRWHPDKNPNMDTTKQMQDVNEAYNILKDIYAKEKYDKEYLMFRQTVVTDVKPKEQQSYEYSYDIKDENLKNDINEARQDAEDFVNQFMKAFRENGNKAINGAWAEVLPYVILIIVMSLISIIILIFQSSQQ